MPFIGRSNIRFKNKELDKIVEGELQSSRIEAILPVFNTREDARAQGFTDADLIPITRAAADKMDKEK
jgi:hypothetical protein